ncbi:MAG: UbiA prenyltransferase family protein [Microgenomates group bacterium]
MVQIFENLFRSIRPRQALKNLSLLAPLVFSGNLFVTEKFWVVIQCVFIFTILTSAVYLINDIVDLPRDRLHPLKKTRPIASGKLPIPIALFIAIIGVFSAFYLSYLSNFFFFLAVIFYFFLQLIYSLVLKSIIVMDVLAVASGFILRVYAGALAINVHMNVWFLLCVVSLALFLAVGKRRAELAILNTQVAGRHRKTLSFYTPDLLDSYLAMFANSAWLSYALFTFFSPPPPISQRFALYRFLPLTLSGINKWLMITIPLVIYGIMRYMTIIYQGSRAESPEKILLSDKPLLAVVLIWGLMVVAILYGVRP